MDSGLRIGLDGPASLASAHHPVQDLVASMLPQADRLCLAATCRTLRAASLRWFPDVQVTLIPGDRAAASSLVAGLCRYRARAHLSFGEAPVTLHPRRRGTAVPGMLRLLAARPAATASVASLSASPGVGNFRHPCEVPTRCLLAFPSLEGLEGGHEFLPAGPLEPLWQLTRLQRLRLNGRGLSGDWAGVARLPRLQRLELVESFDLAAVASVLPALAPSLTALVLHASWNDPVPASWASLARLASLRSLVLHLPAAGDVAAQLPALAPSLQCLGLYAGHTAAPPQLAACSRLTRLELGRGPNHHGRFMTASLSVLGALTRLQHLALAVKADFEIVPAVLGQLSALTHLSLHTDFAGGYARLQPLMRLRELSIEGACPHGELATVLHSTPQLTSLRLYDFFLISAPDWQEILHATQLRELLLDKGRTGPLPAALSTLKALTRLSLCPRTFHLLAEGAGDQPEASLEHLRPLAGTLADLSLAGWRMTAVPPVLTALTALTGIDLSGNRISGGWEQLRALPRLRKLDPAVRGGLHWARMHWLSAAVVPSTVIALFYLVLSLYAGKLWFTACCIISCVFSVLLTLYTDIKVFAPFTSDV